ncbi:MAG: sigma-54-dependent Fis family transcriptional regulator, partial [Candidatus Lambdaproteobacteria bacterium]|nr:sigma-54-dependent Fis family transcriptional regulator [Candidatus Lambdaproteobacteria bacterium]
LRVLQEREFQRVGGLEVLHLRARIIAATNQTLATLVEEGRFRNDLYYRISPFVIVADPLRERREDIPALVKHFLTRSAEKLGLAPRTLTPEAMARLMAYDWPGNVRELENVVKSLIILTASSVIGEADLPRNISGAAALPDRGKSFEESVLRHWSPTIEKVCAENGTGLLHELLSHLERPLIREVLERTRWNQVRAARILGINRNTLRTRMQALGIRKQQELRRKA